MTMQRQFRILALALFTVLAPLSSRASAAPVSADATPPAAAVQTIRAWVCDKDPGGILSTQAAPGCSHAPGGVRFTVQDESGQPAGECVTNRNGECDVNLFDGEQVTITEDASTVPNGATPKQNPISWKATSLGGDAFPTFLNILPASATPEAAAPTPIPTSMATPTPARVVKGTATYLGDNQRTGRWSDPGPQGKVGIAAEVKASDPEGMFGVVISSGLAIGQYTDVSVNGSLGAWDVKSGDKAWSVEITFDGLLVETPILSTLTDGVLFGVLSDGTVLALSAGTGQELWRSRALPTDTKGIYGGILVADGRVYVAIGSYTSAFDKASGKRLWVRELPLVSLDVHPSVLSLANGRLIVPYWNGVDSGIYALNAENGSILWKDDESQGVADGNRFYGFRGSALVAVDASSGSLLWEDQQRIAPDGFPPALSTNGTLYATRSDNNSGIRQIESIDAGSGAVGWTRTLPDEFGKVVDSPALFGNLVIVTQTSGLVAFDAKTGKAAWQVAMPCANLGRLLGIVDGRIYVSEPGGWVVLGGNKGPNKTKIHQASKPPASQGIRVIASKDVTLVDSSSDSGFPVANLKVGDRLTVTGPGVLSQGRTWWPVTADSGGNGYLPEDVLTVTGCPSQ